MTQLEGKITLITGGTAGIGFATAQRMAAEGATVYLTGRSADKAEAAAALIGGDVHGIAADISSLDDLDRVYGVIRERSSRLDIVVANAGGGDLLGIGDVTEVVYDATFDVNVKGTFFTVQKALPLLGDGAAIIIVSSISGITAAPGMSVYGATKAAVRHLARSWALELAPRDIRVAALCPGPVDTPGMEKHLREAAAHGDVVGPTTPLGRRADADEIAEGALFLATATFLSGSDLILDGAAIA
ncbi:SDR family NAD(P)-dependent oxidoreductase [Mycolicibacterium goodii]|uniref:SDR family oxidoreductase n=1 Tax=Mycolicibacterium goodii TaxID=134601 RepID=A0ABS6HS65_MYCGD|nr:SDR family oxidoreductase [Mycolicibacterium goodii]MBU8824770.1 SDR family oxidoreductase [Mycolicibacterium goodii]MBU8840269.1 SDR family oxidoreductase [Mycolicibacterium goodii]